MAFTFRTWAFLGPAEGDGALHAARVADAAARLHGKLAGMEAVVIGRPNIVGKPMAQLLLADSCTVTIAHSRTRDLPGVVRRADIVVAAVAGARDSRARGLDQARRDGDRRGYQPDR